jgi:hypothetical protein
MAANSRLLVADQVFLHAKDGVRPHLVSVFPGASSGDGAYRANYVELKKRGALQSAFYERMLPELVRIAGGLAPAATPALRTLLRPVLVTLTSLFVDRSIRVAHRLYQMPEMETKVAKVQPMHEFERLDYLRNLTGSNWHFNQAMIERIAGGLGIEAECILELDEYPESPVRPAQRNLLMGPPPAEGVRRFIGRVVNRLLTHLRQTPCLFARYSSLGFSGDDYYLSKKGLYGPFGLLESEKNFYWAEITRDPSLRSKLQAGLHVAFPHAAAELLFTVAEGVLPREICERLGASFPAFFADYVPMNFLEGLEPNLDAALKSRNMSRARHLIGTDMVTDEAYFLAAATKMLGGQVVGVQHGGHYGYIEEMSLMAEFEYSLYDRFITWGWTEFDADLPATKAVPLPSPRLSSKPIKFSPPLSSPIISNPTGRDALLMTNLLRRFAHVSTCGQARSDSLEGTLCSQERLVKALVEGGIRVDHKPYSQSAVDFVPEHFAELTRLGGEYYRLLESTQKGLSPALLKDYRVVLWDQIGTGTLDCFVSGIPTMIHWERIYSRESTQASPLIAELENVGVVHSSADSLVREMSHMMADPRAWMQDERRQAAIALFCYRFARTDRRWPALWRQALRALDERKVDEAVFAKVGE